MIGDQRAAEEQEAASSMRPMLSQRKAPANRQLGQSGMGEDENPDANGRGGPGGLKKTRGVAAMLLGVPMPDRLQGAPNPGRMKVQREQSQPQDQFAEAVGAQARGKRDGQIGYVANQNLSPWMEDLVKDYFVSIRIQK